MKKIIATLILLVFTINPVFCADVLHGHIEEVDQYRQLQEQLFTGQVEFLDKKELENMSVFEQLHEAERFMNLFITQ